MPAPHHETVMSSTPPRETMRRSTIAAALLGLVFGVLAVTVTLDWWTGVDTAVTDWIVDHRTPALTSFLRAVSFLGNSPQGTIIAALAVVALWWWTRALAPAAVLAGMACLAAFLSSATKLLVARERPPADMRLVSIRTHSFPSGHVASTTVLVVGLIVVTAGALTGVALLLARIAAATAVVLMAISRVYLGVHWFTDVVGGALLGTAVALLGAIVLARMRTAAPAELP